MTLFLLKYNNYYNRILKKEKELSDYWEYGEFVARDYNFNPNDGITTQIEIGAQQAYNGDCDYCVVAGADIESRWFVIEQKRARLGQYILTLRRDLLADFFDEWYNKPAYVEKGYLQPNDPFIFTKENASFNQIKREENPLKDNTGCAWVVGYMSVPKANETAIEVPYGISSINPDFTVDSISDWDFAQYISSPLKNYVLSLQHIYMKNEDDDYLDFRFNKAQNTEITLEAEKDFELSGGYSFEEENRNIIENLILQRADQATIAEIVCADYGLVQADDTYLALKNLKGQIIQVGNDYKRIEVSDTTVDERDRGVNANRSLGLYLTNLISEVNVLAAANYDINNIVAGSRNQESFGISYTYREVKLSLVDAEAPAAYKFSIGLNRRKLKDAPYCMFCMPYSDDYVVMKKIDNRLTSFKTMKENALTVASAITSAAGSFLYDIQLLPYCPISKLRDSGSSINLENYGGEEGVDYITTNLLEQRQIIFWSSYSVQTFNIAYNYNAYSAADNIGFKVDAETKFCRLCSPNYNGAFEFSPYKNGGISYINVDIHYKPYQPYIHLNPNFSNLYGQDFDDARGLILGGDFSLTTLSNAWTNYEVQNKNYQAMFNRQIENMEFQNDLARKQEGWQVAAGVVSATTSGILAGTVAGGPVVGGIMGAAGGAMSLAGGIADMRYNQMARQETLDYTKDQFALTLDNIKALPNSLTKISSLNNNNKIWPFIEVYTATEEEETALRNKIIYNGMTINRIDTFANLYQNKPSTIELGYFKGKLIRLPDKEDYHLANELAAEINKGVFM